MRLNNTLIVIFLVSFFSQFSFGQRYSVHKKNISYIGFSAGFNFSLPKVKEHYSILSAEGSSENEDFQKDYDKFGKNKGVQFGINYSYNFTNSLAIIAGFGYQTLGFNYFTNYSWVDSVEQQSLDREMHHLQKVSYFSFPIMMRWDMVKGQFMPYLQGGIFMDFRQQGKKEIIYDNTIDEEETENQTSSSGIAPLTDHIRKFNMGLSGGIGLNYYLKRVTFGIEANFRYGFLKIINDENRYADFTGFALPYLDVMDQLKLSNLNFQFSISVPINHSITLNVLRRKRYSK